MAKEPPVESSKLQHRRTRSNRREAGVVAMQLLLPPDLAHRLDEVRGDRPRTTVALEWLFAKAGLDEATVGAPLKRGRPRKKPIRTSALVPQPASPVVAPVPLELVNWERFISRIPDPRRAGEKIPEHRRCWRQEGADGKSRLRWVYQRSDDPRLKFARDLGGQYRHETEHFENTGAWVLPPEATDACIRKFRLVVIDPVDNLSAIYQGWQVEVVNCGLQPGRLCEARLDFEQALKSVKGRPAHAMGLAICIERLRKQGHIWYRVQSSASDLAEGTLVSEPFTEEKIRPAILNALEAENIPLLPRSAPAPWREAWAAVTFRGIETVDGLVHPEPHTGCPGHRLGSLLSAYLESTSHGNAPLLLRSEWDLIAAEAALLGVKAELVPRARSILTEAFDPARIPGWDTPARGDHRLFPFQRHAVEFALDQDARCLIGDEMGLGKTASAIATASAARFQRILVISPVNAIGVWQREVLAWSDPADDTPTVTIVRATDQAPAVPAVGWVLVGYETLAGRDERVLIDDPEAKNALSDFFFHSLGSFRKSKRSGWNLREIPVTQNGRGRLDLAFTRPKRWVLKLKATREVSDAVENLLATSELRMPIGKNLRTQFERVAKRLSRPVMAGLHAWKPELIIADEAHRLKDEAASRTRAVRELCDGRRTLLLTGTPLRNHAVDGKALLEIILPEPIWNVMGRKGEAVVPVVRELLARRMIRRLKAEVLKELPPKLRQRIPVRLELAELEAYAGAMNAAEHFFQKVWAETGSSNKARKAAMGQWATARKELGMAKLRSGVPSAVIADVIAAKEQVIVFAHHREVLDELERRLTETGVTVGRVDGRVDPNSRVEVGRQFQAGELQVFLGGIHAAGEAVTLTRADTVIFVELAWVPGALLQAEDRGHRAGQVASSYHIIHLTADLIPPPLPPAVSEPRLLSEVMPEDWREYERERIASPKLEKALKELQVDYERWQQYLDAKEAAAQLASIENIDEYMIAALDGKIQHINDVLSEKSGPLVGQNAEEDSGAMARLVQATKQKIRRRERPAGAVGEAE